MTKAHKVLKKHFKAVSPNPDRPVLEQLLFACCLENAPYEPAEEVFARLGELFFDWNEVRVSTVPELASVMGALPDPREAASRLKRVLQGVFEATYSFDLEFLRKMNLGQAMQKLHKMTASSPFAASYVTQASLGGHSIPIDRGAAIVCEVLGIINEKERIACTVAGIDRAISKSKGVEFGSLLHQLGAQLIAAPLSPQVQKFLLEIDPDCRERLPKKQPKKKPVPPAPPARKSAAATAGKEKETVLKLAKPPVGKQAGKDVHPIPARKENAPRASAQASEKERGQTAKKPPAQSPARRVESGKKPAPARSKPVEAKKKPAAAKHRESASRLSKRKPR